MLLTELLSKGGVVMALLLMLSVYIVAVVLYKLHQFWSTGADKQQFLDDVLENALDNNLPEAMRITGNYQTPLAKVLSVQLQGIADKKLAREQVEKRVASEASMQLRPYETHLRGLEMVATISPLLGLLGTIIGMIGAFAKIEEVGARIDPSMLAGGIWEALLTTVAGLSVAIPALAAHYLLDGRIEKLRLLMQDAAEAVFANSDAPKPKVKK